MLRVPDRIADDLARLTDELRQPGVPGLSAPNRLLLRIGIGFLHGGGTNIRVQRRVTR